ncbi:MAG TPA: response regulator transcription factor [Tepidisphaeraceae bacterium]|nr:response regulator transcription factor [Tepidisphaeraceae bacterium]
MHLNVLIADDHRILRQGLRSLLENEPDMQVAAEADNGRAAIEVIESQPIDIAIVDVSMPGLNGIEATRKLLAAKPALKVIGLSMHTDRRFVSEMLKAGAVGFVSKDSAFEELVQAIRTVLTGKVYLSPSAAGVVVDDYLRRDASPEAGAFSSLTAREREVLQLMAEGRNTKQIAMDLHVSIKTIETHRRQIMEKLDLYSVAELTKYAIREGLTTLA